MKNIFCISLLISLFVSCGKKEASIPPEVLNQMEMTAILTDIHLAQAAVNNSGRIDSTSYFISDYVEYILKEHNTTKDKLSASLKFYSDNPGMLQVVYDSVLTSLSKLESELEK